MQESVLVQIRLLILSVIGLIHLCQCVDVTTYDGGNTH
jgi:hypothetical protein